MNPNRGRPRAHKAQIGNSKLVRKARINQHLLHQLPRQNASQVANTSTRPRTTAAKFATLTLQIILSLTFSTLGFIALTDNTQQNSEYSSLSIYYGIDSSAELPDKLFPFHTGATFAKTPELSEIRFAIPTSLLGHTFALLVIQDHGTLFEEEDIENATSDVGQVTNCTRQAGKPCIMIKGTLEKVYKTIPCTGNLGFVEQLEEYTTVTLAMRMNPFTAGTPFIKHFNLRYSNYEYPNAPVSVMKNVTLETDMIFRPHHICTTLKTPSDHRVVSHSNGFSFAGSEGSSKAETRTPDGGWMTLKRNDATAIATVLFMIAGIIMTPIVEHLLKAAGQSIGRPMKKLHHFIYRTRARQEPQAVPRSPFTGHGNKSMPTNHPPSPNHSTPTSTLN